LTERTQLRPARSKCVYDGLIEPMEIALVLEWVYDPHSDADHDAARMENDGPATSVPLEYFNTILFAVGLIHLNVSPIAGA
jgi:hypothetical protein